MDIQLLQNKMKTHFQLSIDSDLKRRLEELSRRSDVPIAKIVDRMLREHLSFYEDRISALDQPMLDLSRLDAK